jgi:hypothetical protein
MSRMGKTFNNFAVARHPEIKGYKLLQRYPGCNKEVGEFEPYTRGEFSKFPHIWEPVYHKHNYHILLHRI